MSIPQFSSLVQVLQTSSLKTEHQSHDIRVLPVYTAITVHIKHSFVTEPNMSEIIWSLVYVSWRVCQGSVENSRLSVRRGNVP